MTRLILAIALFSLTACIAPDGETYTVATVGEDNRLQVQHVDIDAEQEFYRGFFTLCAYTTMVKYGTVDVAGCTDLAAVAYAHDAHLDRQLIEHWRYDLVQEAAR